MSNQELIVPGDENAAVRVTVTAIEIPATTARRLTNADELRRAIAPFIASATVTTTSVRRPRPARDALRRWSPLRPFAGMLTNYRLARAALGADGKMNVVYICIAAGLTSIVWRHYAVPIGIAGGILVTGILFVRTGAYREYLAAIESTHGVPPLGAMLRYNLDCLLQWVRALWRR